MCGQSQREEEEDDEGEDCHCHHGKVRPGSIDHSRACTVLRCVVQLPDFSACVDYKTNLIIDEDPCGDCCSTRTGPGPDGDPLGLLKTKQHPIILTSPAGNF